MVRKMHTITVTIDNVTFRMTRDGLEFLNRTLVATPHEKEIWDSCDESWDDSPIAHAAFDALETLERLNYVTASGD